MMSQFMVNPSEDHINKSLHIVRYVNMNLNSKIGYDGNKKKDSLLMQMLIGQVIISVKNLLPDIL
jgi:hypothetical protein